MEEMQQVRHSDAEIDEILAELNGIKPRKEPEIVPEPPEEEPGSWKRELWEWARSLGVAALIAVVLFGFVFRFVMVDGNSMEPTLHAGDRLLMYSLFYQPKSGDVVILSDKTGLEIPLVKRVIAAEGQILEITSAGDVLVDGELLEEPYAAEVLENPGSLEYPITIPKDKVFVMGDNRNHSTDSRSQKIGLVDEKEVLGKVVFRLMPLRDVGLVH